MLSAKEVSWPSKATWHGNAFLPTADNALLNARLARRSEGKSERRQTPDTRHQTCSAKEHFFEMSKMFPVYQGFGLGFSL